MTTAEGTRQGTFCPEKRAPRPVNDRLPTGKGREPVQHGLEGKASGVRGTREGWDVTPRPNQTNGDRRGRRGQEGAGLGNVSEISKSGNVNYTKGTVSLLLFPPSQFLEALGEQADRIWNFTLSTSF